MTKIILKAKNIVKTYTEGKVKTDVLKNVNLDIYEGELTAIIGKSGSGKSTLMHILGTLDTADSGQILFNDLDLTRLSASKKAQFRNSNLGFVYQFHHLLGDFTVKENVMMPLLIGNVPKSEADKRACEYLEKVGLSHRLNYLTTEISGGERQRVAIARALVHKPDLILADEPTGNLDAHNANEIFTLFTNLVREEKLSVVMVTHDNQLAALCDRTYLKSKRFGPLARFISMASTMGICTGVCALIIGLSAMNGFEYELHNRVLSLVPGGEIKTNNYEGFRDLKSVIDTVASTPGVEAVSPVIEINGAFSLGTSFSPALILGIDTLQEKRVIAIDRFMDCHAEILNTEDNLVILGYAIAKKLNVKKGDSVNLSVISRQS